MDKITIFFNNVFENSIRILILLREAESLSFSQEKICALDFITIYGKQFHISHINIHGHNAYSFSEYVSRRRDMGNILGYLVQNGFINVVCSKSGYEYTINENGIFYIENLESEYAWLYQDSARLVISKFKYYDENMLISFITNIKGGGNEQVLD